MFVFTDVTENDQPINQSATTTTDRVLMDQDPSISVGSETCAKLEKELLSSSPSKLLYIICSA